MTNANTTGEWWSPEVIFSQPKLTTPQSLSRKTQSDPVMKVRLFYHTLPHLNKIYIYPLHLTMLKYKLVVDMTRINKYEHIWIVSGYVI